MCIHEKCGKASRIQNILVKSQKMKSFLSKLTKTIPKRCNWFTVWFPKELTDRKWCFNWSFQTHLTKIDISSRVFRSVISDFCGAWSSTISTSSMNSIALVQTSWAATRFARCKQTHRKCNNPWHTFLKRIISQTRLDFTSLDNYPIISVSVYENPCLSLYSDWKIVTILGLFYTFSNCCSFTTSRWILMFDPGNES